MRLENVLTQNTVFEKGDLAKYHLNCYAQLSQDYAIYFRYNERFICHRNTKNPNEWIVIGKYEVSDTHSRGQKGDSEGANTGHLETRSRAGAVNKQANMSVSVDNHPDTPIDLDAIRRSGI